MKICPICKTRTKEDIECPICKATLTYEPKAEAEKEKYVLSKYLLWYFVKRLWFSLVCIAVIVVRFAYIKFEIDHAFYAVITIICASLSLIISLLEGKLIRLVQLKYSKGYSYLYIISSKISFGIFAVICAFVLTSI